MQLPSVDRSANWRGSGAETRSSTVSRLQSLVSPQDQTQVQSASTSVRDLPPLPPKEVEQAQVNVLAPGRADRESSAVAESAQNRSETDTVTSTVDLARVLQTGANAESSVRPEQGIEAYVNVGLDGQTEAARQADELRAEAEKAEQVQNETPPPPKEPPMSKMLMDFVQSLWSASRSAVDPNAAEGVTDSSKLNPTKSDAAQAATRASADSSTTNPVTRAAQT